MKKNIITICVLLISVLAGIKISESVTQEKGQATLTEMKGIVEVLKEGGDTWASAKEGMLLERGDQMKTGKDSFAEVTMDNGNVIRLEDNTDLTLVLMTFGEHSTVIQVASGKVLSNVLKLKKKKAKTKFTVRTPTSVACVRGTEFVVDTNAENTEVGVFDGEVSVQGLDDKGKELPETTVIKINQQTTITLRNRPAQPFLMKPSMAEYREKVMRLRERAESNRKRIEEFMKQRGQIREQLIKDWQNTQNDKLKEQLKKIEDNKNKEKKIYEEKKPKLLKE